MDIYNDPTATAQGEFTDGDPLANPAVPRTVLKSEWTNMIQRELVNTVQGAGLTLDGNDFTQLLQAINALAEAKAQSAAGQAAPTGTVAYFAGITAPAGWLALNGQSIGDVGSGADNEGDEYQALFVFLWENFEIPDINIAMGRGTSAIDDWNAGKAMSIMDDRGLVHRGFDGTGTVDPDRGAGDFGTYQADEIKEHTHNIPANSSSGGANTYLTKLNNNTSSPSQTSPTGGAETRMKNRAYTPIIKV